MTGFKELALVTIASAFGFGMVQSILEAVKAPLAQRIGASEVKIAGWLDASKIALLPLTLLSGILADHVGARWIIILGSLVLGLAFFGLALCRDLRGLVFVLSLMGAGLSCLGIGAVVLMPAAFFGPNAASANIGYVFFPLGALVAPSFVDIVIERFSWRRALSGLAVVGLIPALLAALSPAAAYPHLGRPADFGVLLTDPFLWLMGLVFLLYAPLEGAVGSWAHSYLVNLGFSPGRATGLVTGYWVIFMASRLLAAYGLHSLNHDFEPWVLLALAVLAAVALGMLVGSHHPHQGGWSLLLTAAVLGPIFPLLVGIIYKNFEEAELGSAYGMTYALGGLGALLCSSLMTAYARQSSMRAAMRFPILLAVLLAGTSLVVALAR